MSGKIDESILDRACCCLTLRQGTILVGVISLLVDIVIIARNDIVLHKVGQPLNGFDYIILFFFGFGMIPQDIAIIIGALRESAKVFQGYNKASYAFSNFYTILLVIFCDRAWNQGDKVLKAVILYIVYCGILGGYFLVVTRRYASQLNQDEKLSKQQQTQNA